MAVALLVTTPAAVTLLTVGLMGLTGRLPRNHFAGIRTRATLASDEAWSEAHRIGSAPLVFTAVAATMAGPAVLPFVLASEVGSGLAATIVVAQAILLAAGAIAARMLADRVAKSHDA